ncbi:MAG: hypothetical protein DMG11_28695, partial [Acidobacteria bacterium]
MIATVSSKGSLQSFPWSDSPNRFLFQNLLSNAIEYTSHEEITIGAAVSNADRVIRCWVRDTGRGIPEDR